MQTVELRKVSHSFGRFWALRDVSLTFADNQVSVVCGENGAGKSVLLRILATLLRPERGDILYDGEPWTTFAGGSRNRIGIASHTPMLYGHLSARENLEFFAELHGLDPYDELIESWLDRVGLYTVASRPVQTFSRGMLQRLSLARALLHDPSVVLLDEPWTGIDARGRENIWQILESLVRPHRICIITTHQLDGLGSLGDYSVVLRDGRVLHEGPIENRSVAEIYAQHH